MWRKLAIIQRLRSTPLWRGAVSAGFLKGAPTLSAIEVKHTKNAQGYKVQARFAHLQPDVEALRPLRCPTCMPPGAGAHLDLAGGENPR
jgi:hypothetical protein